MEDTGHRGLITRIRHRIAFLRHRGHSVSFIWIRGHAGTPCNHAVDALAKEAATSQHISIDRALYIASTVTTTGHLARKGRPTKKDHRSLLTRLTVPYLADHVLCLKLLGPL